MRTQPVEKRRMFSITAHGVSVEGAQTMHQVMARAGLNWKIEMQPVTLAHEMAGNRAVEQNLDELWIVNRSSDHKVLGVVDRGYKLVQNVDALEFLDAFMLNHSALPYRAGTFHNDKVLWVILELPEAIKITSPHFPKQQQTMRRFFLVTSSHERRDTVEFQTLPCRSDGVLLPFVRASKLCRFKHVQHENHERLHGIRAFEKTVLKYQELGESLQWMANTQMRAESLRTWVQIAFPQKWERYYDPIRELFVSEIFSGTMFAAVSAMCRFVDTLSDDTFSRWSGENRLTKESAFFKLAGFAQKSS